MVRRVRDPHDHRWVIVEPNQERLAELDQAFSSLQESFRALLDICSDEQLATIADYLTRAARRSQEFIASQTSGSGES
jgi:hypothetical protein